MRKPSSHQGPALQNAEWLLNQNRHLKQDILTYATGCRLVVVLSALIWPPIVLAGRYSNHLWEVTHLEKPELEVCLPDTIIHS